MGSMVLEQDVAFMLLKKLGKKFSTRVEIIAVKMDAPFTFLATNGSAGDYLVQDVNSTSISVMTADEFKRYKSTRQTKPTITRDTPPGAPSAHEVD